jgi:hypothetical protein
MECPLPCAEYYDFRALFIPDIRISERFAGTCCVPCATHCATRESFTMFCRRVLHPERFAARVLHPERFAARVCKCRTFSSLQIRNPESVSASREFCRTRLQESVLHARPAREFCRRVSRVCKSLASARERVARAPYALCLMPYA